MACHRFKKRRAIVILLVSSLLTSGHAAGLESLQPRIYSGTPIDLLPVPPEAAVRYQLPATLETPASFSNIPAELDLSYLSMSPQQQQVSALGNVVGGCLLYTSDAADE